MPHLFTRRSAVSVSWLLLVMIVPVGTVRGQTVEDQLKSLKQELEELRRSEAEKQRKLDQLQHRLEQLEAAPAAAPAAKPAKAPAVQPVAAPSPPASRAEEARSALDRELEAIAPQESTTQRADAIWARQVGGTQLRLIDISLDTLLAAGTSTADDEELVSLQGGAHDPNQRGFTLQQVELSFSGAVDPYLIGEAHIIYTLGGVELEEAFMTSTSLPYGLQIEAGYFFTEFGIINPLHPHAWDWIDQPVINTRMFGGEGLRSPGVRIGWLTPLPWYAHIDVGMQNADEGEFTISFDGDGGIGGYPAVPRGVHNLGDMLYLMRLDNFWNLTDEIGFKLGLSALHGPNNTGSDGQTWIYGTDMKVRWRPKENFRGWPFLVWQTEAMKRDYTASYFLGGTPEDPGTGGHGHSHGDEGPPMDEEELPPLAGSILRDYGFYSQLLYGFTHGWAAGLRFEYVTGNGEGVNEGGRAADPFRDNRYRLSPLIVWQPTEFSRFRLQYNYDNADFAPVKDASTVWVGAEILYGMHPAHKY